MQAADKQTYKVAILAWYKRALKKQWLEFDWTFKNKTALDEAEDLADSTLSTADYGNAPNVYKSLYSKQFFRIL